MILGLVAGLAACIALPHVMELERTPPLLAAAMWTATLVLRALASLLVATGTALYLPQLGSFVWVSRECWHAVLPGLAEHLVVSGHAVGDLALAAPAGALMLSLAWGVVGLARALRRVDRIVIRAAITGGPRQSSIVADRGILLATAGLLRPRVVVSAGALLALDAEELAAGLDHERGHIAHHHRWILVFASLCRDVGRFVPGAGRAERELRHHLERDADAFALRRSSPAILARAIGKAAATPAPGRSTQGISGGSTLRRVEGLVKPPPPGRRRAGIVAVATTALLLASVLATGVGLAAATAEAATTGPRVAVEHCHHADALFILG